MKNGQSDVRIALNRFDHLIRSRARVNGEHTPAKHLALVQNSIEDLFLQVEGTTMRRAAVKADLADVPCFGQQSAQKFNFGMAGRYQFWMKAKRHPDALPVADELARPAPRPGGGGHGEDKCTARFGFVQDGCGIGVEIYVAVKIDQVTPRF